MEGFGRRLKVLVWLPESLSLLPVRADRGCKVRACGQFPRTEVSVVAAILRSCLNLFVQAIGRGFRGMAPRFSKEDSPAL